MIAILSEPLALVQAPEGRAHAKWDSPDESAQNAHRDIVDRVVPNVLVIHVGQCLAASVNLIASAR